MRTSILLALVTGALVTGSTTAGAAAATPRCTTAALEVWLGVGGGGGQAGSVSYPMEFTNVSGHTCHLFGFPGVSAEAAGHQLGSAARRDHSAPEQTVTLRAGATAHTVLRITDVSAFPAATLPTGHRRRAHGLSARRGHRGPDPVPIPCVLGEGAGVPVGHAGAAAGRRSRASVVATGRRSAARAR